AVATFVWCAKRQWHCAAARHRIESGGGLMTKGHVEPRQRAEALTWLISRGARLPINVARGRLIAWLRNRRGHSSRGVTAADRAALRVTNPALLALRE